jgi:hypothetical protein
MTRRYLPSPVSAILGCKHGGEWMTYRVISVGPQLARHVEKASTAVEAETMFKALHGHVGKGGTVEVWRANGHGISQTELNRLAAEEKSPGRSLSLAPVA